MTKLDDLIKRLSDERSGCSIMPEDFDSFLKEFIPNHLFKDDTFQKAMGVTEQEMQGVYKEAYFFYQKQDYKNASHLFRALAILNPYRSDYWLGLGGSLQLLGEFEKALEAYGVMTHLAPQDPTPHRQAYECYIALGNKEEADLALMEEKRLKLLESPHASYSSIK